MEGKETYLYFGDSGTPNSAGVAVVYPASGFRGIDPINAQESDISFKSTSGDNLDDTIRFTHATGKYKELCQAMAILLNSDGPELVVVYDENSSIIHKLLVNLGVAATEIQVGLDT